MTEFEKKFKEKTGENFNNYYKEYKPKLTWYLTKYTKNFEMADEFANMAFVQGLEKIDTYNSEVSKFITWVTSIAINIVIKDFKDRKKHNISSLDNELKENFTLSSILSYDDDKDKKIKDEEDNVKCELIKKVINDLPDKYKKVMIMRELDRMSYKDISNNVFKEKNVTLTNEELNMDIDEYFYSVTITNKGSSNLKVEYEDDGYSIIIEPKEEMLIIKEDINQNNKININSNNTITNLNIKQTTNLSTIKSQIKKGRFLIRKKVKKDFELINKNGVR